MTGATNTSRRFQIIHVAIPAPVGSPYPASLHIDKERLAPQLHAPAIQHWLVTGEMGCVSSARPAATGKTAAASLPPAVPCRAGHGRVVGRNKCAIPGHVAGTCIASRPVSRLHGQVVFSSISPRTGERRPLARRAVPCPHLR